MPGDNAKEIVGFATFLAASARGALEVGPETASLRLADAIRRLHDVLPDEARDPVLEDAVGMIEEGLNRSYLADRTTYIAFLDELFALFARAARAQHGLDPIPGTETPAPGD